MKKLIATKVRLFYCFDGRFLKGNMMNVIDTCLTDAARLYRNYVSREDLSTDATLVNFRIFPLLFEGKLEEAYDLMKQIASDSLREKLQCELLELLIKSMPESRQLLNDFYRSEASEFALWFMGKTLDRKESLVRELILKEIWRGKPTLSYHWTVIFGFSREKLDATVRGAIRRLVEAY
ncbi:hypothetical protein MK805_05045 [Shimazuella sp. AN120528]|uniref:hypothetical protein n=1 Tax=Shimazuella soli TaxID=1892854 RepID=UPI001F1138AA|nr:hypothetical protein [Shimazuella soli]MCH5584335.1 hypothetical protein [Shimazuella soli]